MAEPDNSVRISETAAAGATAAAGGCCAPASGEKQARFRPSLAQWASLVAIAATLGACLLLRGADAKVQRLAMAAANVLAPGLALALCLPQVLRHWRLRRTANGLASDVGPRLASAVCISLAFLLFTAGQCVWYYHDLASSATPHSTWAAASYLLGHPCLVVGVLLLPGRRLPDLQRSRVLMDTSMTLAAVATFIWYFLLGPVLLDPGGAALHKVLAAAYPLADLLVLFCLLVTMARAGGAAPPAGTMALCLGLLLFVICNVVYGYQSLRGTYVPGTPLDAGWPLAYVLAAVGAAVRLGSPDPASPAAAARGDGDVVASGIASLLPYALAPLVAALVLATLYEPSGGLVIGVYAGAAVILLLLVLRQVLVIRQNARLYAEVSSAYRQLEQSHRSLETANAALAQSEERFRAAAECASDLLYEYDTATGRLDWFGDIDAQLGYAPGSLPRTLAAWEEAIHPDDRERVTAALTRHIEDGEAFDIEYRVRSADGEYRHWIDRGRLVTRARRTAGGAASGRMVGVVSDVTERKRLEALEGERAALRQAVSAMEGVLGVVGHELRTPLAGLRAMSEFLLTDGAVQSAECEQMLGGINEEVVRMAETVNDLLEAARLNSGLAKWNWSQFDLGPVCADALDPVRPLVDGQAVGLHCEVEPGCEMRGDADAVRRLVMNLVSNARRFTASGSIRVAARQVADGGRRWVEISVADTGAGIPPEIRDRLGEAFALNAGLVGANHVSGTGLGLAICKGIAAAHGGRLSVQSELGAGTTVVARLRADLETAITDQGKAAVSGLETWALTRNGR